MGNQDHPCISEDPASHTLDLRHKHETLLKAEQKIDVTFTPVLLSD